VQRDSIVYKITRGNEAIDNNIVLKKQIVKRDSVIALQLINNSICFKSLLDHKIIITNLELVINNKDKVININKKIARRKYFWKTVKGIGIGAGAVAGFVLFN
jgi:hypothetical protein